MGPSSEGDRRYGAHHVEPHPGHQPEQHTAALSGNTSVVDADAVIVARLQNAAEKPARGLRGFGFRIAIVMRCGGQHRDLMSVGDEVAGEIGDEARR